MASGEWFAQLYQESYRSLVLTAYALLRDIGEGGRRGAGALR